MDADAQQERDDAGDAPPAADHAARRPGRRRHLSSSRAWSLNRLRRRVFRHAVALVICQSAVAVGYFFYDRQALRSDWSALSHHWLVPLTSPLWICLPYALVAESTLRWLRLGLLAIIPVVAIVPAVWFLAGALLAGDATPADMLRTGGWLMLIFLTYWFPLLAIWRWQRASAAAPVPGQRNAIAPQRHLFSCRRCWRPLRWDSRRSLRHLWLLLLMRPAVCDTCHLWRLAPFFWRHRREGT